jgi:hypothetical protein
VNFARPAGTLPGQPIVFNRRIDRSGAFAAAGVLAALNAQAAQILGALNYNSTIDSVMSLAGISAVVWTAMYAALRIGLDQVDGRLRGADAAVLAAVVALSFLPVSLAAKLGLLLCGTYLFISSAPSSSSRRVALILLALTGPLIWGRILLELFAVPILGLDAHLVGFVTGTEVAGNTVRFASKHGRMLIGEACSSVHNISLALVLWTTAAAAFRIRIDRRYLAVGVLMMAWMFLLNIARLATMGLRPHDYIYLHNGAGAAMFGWAGLIGVAAIAGVGVIRAAGRQR